METISIDMRGQICPSTLISALREINVRKGEIRSGAITLVFMTDNRDSTVTIPETAEKMGYAAKVSKHADCYRIEISAAKT